MLKKRMCELKNSMTKLKNIVKRKIFKNNNFIFLLFRLISQKPEFTKNYPETRIRTNLDGVTQGLDYFKKIKDLKKAILC